MSRQLALLAVLSGFLVTVGFVALQAQDTPEATRTVETGTIDDDMPFIEYTLEVEQDGSTIELDIVPTEATSNLDTVLWLLDADSAVVANNDDRPNAAPGDLSSRIVFPQAEAGDYRVIATRFGDLDGTSAGDFELTLVVTPPDDVSLSYDVSDDSLEDAGFPLIDPAPTADWTVLAYYGADTNLEQAIIQDFKEFERAGGSTEDVRVLVLLDRHPEYSESSGNWVGARLYEVAADDTDPEETSDEVILSSEELAIFGENVDSGDGELLAQFLTWGVRSFPAENYVVALGSHGAAWRGIITDDSGDQTIITLPQLEAAFSAAVETAERDTFALLINDACLMSSVEYHALSAAYFDYSLASPEIVVDPAHDMTTFTESIRENDPVDFPVLGTELVDLYIERDVQQRPSPDTVFFTSAITALNQFDPVVVALESFAEAVQENPAATVPLLGQARSNAYVYSGFMNRDDLVDLGSLMQEVINVADAVEDADLIDRAQAVIDALAVSVQYGNAGPVALNRTSTYHNIYFPSRSSDFDSAYFEQGGLATWGAMLRTYYNTVTPKVWDVGTSALAFHEPTAPQVKITNIYPTTAISTATGLEINLQIIGRNVDSVDVTIDRINADGTVTRATLQRVLDQVGSGDQIIRVNRWRSGLDRRFVIWDATVPQVTDGENTHFEFLNIGAEVASLEGRYREPGSDVWNPVTLVFDVETGAFSRAVNQNAENDAVGVIDIPVGSDVETFTNVVTGDGRLSIGPGNAYVWPEGGLAWSFEPAPSGEYEIGLTAVAFGGTQTTVTTQVSLDNEDVDPDLRGTLRTFLGFNVVYPETWDSLTRFEQNFWFRAQSPDGDSRITVYESIVEPETDDFSPIIGDVSGYYGLAVDADTVTPIELNDGSPALEFTYTLTEGETPYQGRGIAIFTPGGGTFAAVAITVETTGTQADLDAIYDPLLDNLDRFDIAEVRGADTSDWSRDGGLLDGGAALLPRPTDWIVEAEQVEEGEKAPTPTGDIWRTYTPSDDALGGEFFALAEIGVDPRQPREAVLELIVEKEVTPLVDGFEVIATQTYNGRYHTWDTVIYDAERDGEAVQGRLYVTLLNQRAYALWLEVPDTNDGAALLVDTMEFMVDGVEVASLPLERVGVIPELVNTGPSTARAASDEEPALLVRYDGRSMVVMNRLPSVEIDLSDLEFVQVDGSNEPVFRLSMDVFTVGDVSEVRPRDCYQLWAQGYVDLPGSMYPADECRTRQGFGYTISPFWLSETPETSIFQVLLDGDLLATCLTVPPVDPDDYVAEGITGEQVSCLAALPQPEPAEEE